MKLPKVNIQKIAPLLYILIVPAYFYGWTVLTEQKLTYSVFDSKFTVNIVILFFMVGVLIERATKHMPRWKGWAITIGATLGLILFFKYAGGLDTWW